MMRPRLWLLLFAVLFVASPAGKVFAHAALQETSPAAGATLSEPVKEITATFSGNIQPMSTLTVVDQTNKQLKPDRVEVAGNKLTALFDKALAAGVYTVQWQNVADDGHASKGNFTFTVGAEAGAAAQTGSAAGGASGAVGHAGTTAGAPAAAAAAGQGQSGMKRYAPAAAIVVVCLLAVLAIIFFVPKRKQGKRD